MARTDTLLLPFLDALVLMSGVILLTRINGLRSFSQMSSFDFAMTVATGSIIGAVVVAPDRGPDLGLAALAAVFLWQWLVARLRRRSDRFESVVDNRPVLLMDGATVLQDNLDAVKMARGDLMSKLRAAGISDLDEVRAVVFETAGTVSVIRGTGGSEQLDPALLAGVVRDSSAATHLPRTARPGGRRAGQRHHRWAGPGPDPKHPEGW